VEVNKRMLAAMVRVQPERAIVVIGAAIAVTGEVRGAARLLRVDRKVLFRWRQRLGPDKVWAEALRQMRAT
jgi:hypothetical protein